MNPVEPELKGADAKELAMINAELEAVAMEIATLLKHPGFRGQLRGEINGAKTRESIIVLDKFLAKVAKQQKPPPGLAKAHGATDKAANRIKNSPAWAFEGIDLYFPVGEHKAKWKGNEDLLVAYSPVNDETEVKSIVAFSVKTGEKVTLDPRKPPTTPVLVVAAEEHDNHELPVATRSLDDVNMDEEGAEELGDIHYTGRDPEEKPVEQEEGNSYVGLRLMYMRDDKEPWTRGDPEVKIFFGQRQGNYCRARYSGTDGALRGFNKTRSWRTTWFGTPPRTPGCQTGGYSNGSSTCFYFDNNFYSKMVLYVYEQDGGNRRQKLYNLYSGVTCNWSYYSDDDYMDSTVMYRSNFPFNYDYGQDMGNVVVRWHKVH